MDLEFIRDDFKFSARVSALIYNNNQSKILLFNIKGRSYYALPGGKILELEESLNAIKREVKEEIGFNNLEFSFFALSEEFVNDKGYNNHQLNIIYKAIYKETKTKQQTTELLLGATLPSLNFSDEDESFILSEYKKEWDEQIRLIDSIPDESFIKSYVKLIDRLYYNKICREVKLREYLGERKFKQYVEGCVLYSGQLVLNTSKNVLVGKWELIQRNDERPVAPVYKSF